MSSSPDPTLLLQCLEITEPLIGVYDAPEAGPFAPLAEPGKGHRCVFAYVGAWRAGKTLRLTPEQFGCGGAGRWLCDVQTRPREDFLEFLAEEEGLKASRELMGRWVDAARPYHPAHGALYIGPLRADQYAFLKTVTFLVDPDQLSGLIIGANYHAAPEDAPPVIAPFGSGCMQLLTVFANLEVPQACIGATDLAMRQYLPPAMLALTVTRPMFERLCALDERSFLFRPFLERLRKARRAQRPSGR
jgi:hypothetical protein